MAGLLPKTAVLEMAAEPSGTWKFDLETGRVGGRIDGAEALCQAAALRLLTPRYEHCIYSFRYGSELAGLIGRDGEYALAAAPALVEEALLRDPRIRAVRDAEAHRDGDALMVKFTAEADWGVFRSQVQVGGQEGKDGISEL